ncbi:hypothetical protein C8J57DRAFT_1232415 [Mycena rebaudengoi]|nr:hypothetical protein C8J57DRAFT_1232415 [Mycena rebaudengoi]
MPPRRAFGAPADPESAAGNAQSSNSTPSTVRKHLTARMFAGPNMPKKPKILPAEDTASEPEAQATGDESSGDDVESEEDGSNMDDEDYEEEVDEDDGDINSLSSLRPIIEWDRTPSTEPAKVPSDGDASTASKSARGLTPPLLTRKRALEIQSSSVEIHPTPEGAPSKRAKLASKARPSKNKILVTKGYAGDVVDKISGLKSPAVIGQGVAGDSLYGQPPTSQRVLKAKAVPDPDLVAPPASATIDPADPRFQKLLLLIQESGLGPVAPEQLQMAGVPVLSSDTPPPLTSGSSSSPAIPPSKSKIKHGVASKGKGKVVEVVPSKPKRRGRPPTVKSEPASSATAAGSVKDQTNTPSNVPPKRKSKAAKSSSTIDERILTVDDLPDVDETFNLELQSSLLSETYIGRPNLRQVTVYSWSDREGPGNMDATNWPDIIDNLPDEEVMMAFKFVQSGKYINPGQLDPRECNAAMPIYIKESEYRYTIRVGDATAIFVSTGMSVVSSLTKPTGAGSAAKKFLSVRPHSQEAERTIAFIGALLHQRRLYMQLDADAVTYSTRSLQYSDNSLASSSKAPMIKGIQSPARVPVYDGRTTPFDLNKHADKLNTVLPKYEVTEDGEIIEGSFVIVGYTVTSYATPKSDAIAISHNLQWVIVLGEPPET